MPKMPEAGQASRLTTNLTVRATMKVYPRLIRLIPVLVSLGLASCQAETENSTEENLEKPPKVGTKIEAFKPEAGSVVTLAYSEIGAVGKIEAEAREHRDNKGDVVRGMLFRIREDEYKSGAAYVDEDELPELLNAIDALLEVTANPSKLAFFEQKYSTRGDLTITAFNSSDGSVSYVVRAGDVVKAQDFVEKPELQKLADVIKKGRDLLQEIGQAK